MFEQVLKLHLKNLSSFNQYCSKYEIEKFDNWFNSRNTIKPAVPFQLSLKNIIWQINARRMLVIRIGRTTLAIHVHGTKPDQVNVVRMETAHIHSAVSVVEER